jgi:uncharacterized surface protein with fasciclin (FAS1) repeats
VFSPDESIQYTVKGLLDGLPDFYGARAFYAYTETLTGLWEQLDGPGPVTLFLPDERAWIGFLAVTGREEQPTFQDKELMSEVLSYLTVTDRQYTHADLLKMDGQEITTAGGRKLRVTVRNGAVYFPSANPQADSRFSRGMTRIAGGVKVKNGYIHILDWVPLPRDRTLELITCEVGKFGCYPYTEAPEYIPGFCIPGNMTETCVPITDDPMPEAPTTTAATATTVLPDLSRLETAWEILNWEGQPFGWFVEAIGILGLEDLLKGPGPVTAFVPPNSTFEEFFKILGIKKQQVFGNKELLTKIINYLLVTGTNRYLAEDLFPMDGQSLVTLGGAELPLTVLYGVARIPGSNPYGDIAQGGPLSKIYGSYTARNGAVHVIDWVPLPPDVRFVDLLKCPSGSFGCFRKDDVDPLRPGFCDPAEPRFGCIPLPKD